MAQFRGYEYVERWPGSPRISLTGGRPRVERVFDIAWEDLYGFCRELVGYPEITYPGGDAFVSRVLPDGFAPEAALIDGQPWPGWLWCTDITSVQGLGVDGNPFASPPPITPITVDGENIARYKLARVTALYEALPYPVRSDDEVGGTEVPDGSVIYRYISYRAKPQLDFFTPPVGSVKWVSSVAAERLPVLQSLPIRQPKVELQYTWHEVPLVDPTIYISAIFTHLGTVNDNEFDGYNPGTILLVGIDVRGPFWKFSPLPLFDYTYYISFFDPSNTGDAGHNFFLRMNGVTEFPYQEVSSDGTGSGRKLYEPADWSALFTPE